MFQCCDMKFSELKGKDVIDNSGEKIGRVSDLIFSYADNKLELRSVSIGGSRIEEFLESIGVKEDDDPIFTFDCVDRFEENALHLGVECANLGPPVSVGEQEMKLSTLSKMQINDSDGMKVGNIIDVWFDTDGHMWFVVGGGVFEELLERMKIRPDIDLLVPQEFIDNISESDISLKYTKFQLEATCQKEYDRYKREVASRHEPGDARHEMLRLGGGPSRGMA